MSASLVGSEMCIRDSLYILFCGVGPESAVTVPTKTQGPTPNYNRQVPVSYTHLTLPTICSV
eukprot:12322271-Alexandrium_andersonii.AAC.1